MLVLTRSQEEEILIGDDDVKYGIAPIVIKVLSVENGRVRLGFEAESDLIILRKELAVPPPSLRENSDENISSNTQKALQGT